MPELPSVIQIARNRSRAMLTHVNVFKAGAVLAAVTGGFHLFWVLMVAAGWAQSVIDFILWAHFIKPFYVVDLFEPVRALILLGLTTAVGFLMGLGAACAWNGLHS